jgi:diguanylate cyclase (GGDEF)-like protein
MPPFRPARSGTRLFLAYAACSLVPVVALGAVLVRGNAQDALERGLAHGRAQAAVVQEMAIAPALHGGDLSAGLTVAERERLQTATDLAIFRGTIIRLRIRDFEGSVLFADDAAWNRDREVEKIDVPVPVDDPAFVAAANGATEVALVDGLGTSSAIRVLQPILADASGRSVGVLELALPYDAVAAEVHAASVRTYWRLCAGLALLYVVLGGISWSTTRRLRRQATQAEHDALHDSLTGLPNRALFRRRLEDAVNRGAPGAVVLVDLDRFKEVNDSLGHHAGDQLLVAVAERLRGAVRDGDTVARLGGDEFGLLLPDLTDPAAARDLVSRVCEALTEELHVQGVRLSVEASFGIALHPTDGRDVETLLNSADAAMYQGKRGADAVVVFDRALATEPSHLLSIQHDLRRAMDDDDLRLEYQPQVDLDTGRVVSVEALLRWDHPERGLLLPGAFLPGAEQTAVIAALTEWVVRRALTDCAAWTAAGHDWDVAVNVSGRNLEQEGFAATVAALAAQVGVPPERLTLEVTETALPSDLAAASRTLSELRAYGFATSLDDFGVGFASLSHLRSLALTEVKIDRAFVSRLDENQEDREVVRSLVRLAHGLGLSVCAEGVETADAADWLGAVGADRAQGYLFSRSLPWPALPSLAVSSSPTPTREVLS